MFAIQELERAILALPVEQRVTLAESLLSSLPPVGEVWSEADELAEAERREQEIQSGRVQPLPEAEFWARIEAQPSAVKVEFHPAVEQDVAGALHRYDAVSSRLGEEFKAELRCFIAAAAEKPGRFHLLKPGWHRANLKRFPYHFIYRELPDGIRVTLVRHHRRDPAFGMKRQ